MLKKKRQRHSLKCRALYCEFGNAVLFQLLFAVYLVLEEVM